MTFAALQETKHLSKMSEDKAVSFRVTTTNGSSLQVKAAVVPDNCRPAGDKAFKQDE
jgi:hypothetical protein